MNALVPTDFQRRFLEEENLYLQTWFWVQPGLTLGVGHAGTVPGFWQGGPIVLLPSIWTNSEISLFQADHFPGHELLDLDISEKFYEEVLDVLLD
jgi:hypothetical protein